MSNTRQPPPSSSNSIQSRLLDIERKLQQLGFLSGIKKTAPPTNSFPTPPISEKVSVIAGKQPSGSLTSPLPRRPLPLIPLHGQNMQRPPRLNWPDFETESKSSRQQNNGRTFGQSSSEQCNESDRRLSEIMKLTGILNINGKEYRCLPEDLESLGDLGHGTCGHVVKMRHPDTGYVMAIKQMRRSGNKEENKRIIMDLDVVLRSHDCDSIVRCLGCFITDSDVWICMELMATCLDKLIKRIKTGIPEPILGKMAVSILKALLYLKEKQKIIHRDVKPSNMLLDWKGTIKLCDFGISGRLIDSKAKTRAVGCAAYMAPERIDPPDPRNTDYDTRADVWSLGISLVELATGRFPYHGCINDFELLTRILQEEPPHLSPEKGPFTPEFCTFVNDCLKKDCNIRPTYRMLLDYPFIKRYENADVNVASWFQRAMENSPSADANCNNVR